ncbi:28S ribosomal protein S7, mitochondrial [Dufourea novaeangliae]|uniref:28S ribosomal protein S7, mitochondrial n=2 Tax=Dufourea novaeangliae TaxID=178035 RepID=A0A154P5Y3_DUFNO|nr:28S ribosomal protein S7, mitochondrial [Dufourea novaeangliae]
MFPSSYRNPIFKKDEQEKVLQSEEGITLAHMPIKSAFTSDTSSEFHDVLARKFMNYIMRDGRKVLARSLLEKTFENIKVMQLEHYNKSSPEQKQYIELNPKVILERAIQNCTPILQLKKIKKGGITYQVPVPVTDTRASFLSMNWLIRSAKGEATKTPLPTVLARELLDAASNKGRVVKKKQELHRQCEANRAYAHFRWT